MLYSISNRYHKIGLSVLGGLLLSLPWVGSFSAFFQLIGFIPLLILEDQYFKDKTVRTHSLFGYSFLCFLIWNTAATWWIGIATVIGSVMLIIFNSTVFAAVFWLFHFTKRTLGLKSGNFLLLIIWLAFEYIYLRTEISWPWLHLGNVFAKSAEDIQWYEYTGILGGSLWTLAVNVLLADTLISYIHKPDLKIFGFRTGLTITLIILPILVSLNIYKRYGENADPVKIAVIQPNIDPYRDKFGKLSPESQLKIILDEAKKVAAPDIDYYIGPETAVQGYNIESGLTENPAIIEIRKFLQDYPRAKFIIGTETVKEYSANESIPHTARKSKTGDFRYDQFNSALQIDSTSEIKIYHKSKLVVGVEKVPFSKYFPFLSNYPIKIGGTYGGLGYQDIPENFESSDKKYSLAPIICYESVYGEYVTEYTKLGTNILVVITNDGWWKNTEGMRQHLQLSRLRAIEVRRSLARSANTGISAFINQRGDIVESVEWGERKSIVNTLNVNNSETFYSKHGDYLGKLAWYSGLLIVFFCVAIKLMFKLKKNNYYK